MREVNGYKYWTCRIDIPIEDVPKATEALGVEAYSVANQSIRRTRHQDDDGDWIEAVEELEVTVDELLLLWRAEVVGPSYSIMVPHREDTTPPDVLMEMRVMAGPSAFHRGMVRTRDYGSIWPNIASQWTTRSFVAIAMLAGEWERVNNGFDVAPMEENNTGAVKPLAG